MILTDVLKVLAEITPYQWGMVTTPQARAVGVSRLALSRLAQAGHLVRLAHAVYLDAGVPTDEFQDLRAAWLSTEPARMAADRLQDISGAVVVAGASAAHLHRVGDLWAGQHEFVSSRRRQSQRSEIRYRQRALDPQDMTIISGLPVMTVERTIADLVEEVGDLSLTADVLRDASESRALDFERLRELLAPLASRHGFGKGDGTALLEHLMKAADLDPDVVARKALVEYVRVLPQADIDRLGAFSVSKPVLEEIQRRFLASVGAEDLARALARRTAIGNPQVTADRQRQDTTSEAADE